MNKKCIRWISFIVSGLLAIFSGGCAKEQAIEPDICVETVDPVKSYRIVGGMLGDGRQNSYVCIFSNDTYKDYRALLPENTPNDLYPDFGSLFFRNYFLCCITFYASNAEFYHEFSVHLSIDYSPDDASQLVFTILYPHTWIRSGEPKEEVLGKIPITFLATIPWSMCTLGGGGVSSFSVVNRGIGETIGTNSGPAWGNGDGGLD